jgi:hypothetical protein
MIAPGGLQEDDFEGELLRSVLPGDEHERGWLVFISTLGTVVDWAWMFTRSFTRATGSQFLISIVYIYNTPPFTPSTRDALTQTPIKNKSKKVGDCSPTCGMRSLSGVKTRKVVPQERRTKMLDE